MKKIKFASRHELTEDQKADIARIWGDDAEIVTEAIIFTDIGSVADATCDCDILIAVLPQVLALQVGNLHGIWSTGENERLRWTEKVVTALSVPAPAKDGEPRRFEHAGFYSYFEKL